MVMGVCCMNQRQYIIKGTGMAHVMGLHLVVNIISNIVIATITSDV